MRACARDTPTPSLRLAVKRGTSLRFSQRHGKDDFPSLAEYADAEEGGYFMTANDGEELLVREKPSTDGAVPSGNSVAALNLLRLRDFTDNAKWREQAEALFTSLGGRLQRAPTGSPALLVALDYYYDVPLEIAVVAEADLGDTAPLANRLRR